MRVRFVELLCACIAVAIAVMLVSSIPGVVFNRAHEPSSATVPASGTQRTVDYHWYDMFNIPFGSFWDLRAASYGTPLIMSYSYPHTYQDGDAFNGFYTYSSMRLNVTGRNMPEINMNSWPEFLPMLGSTRGGNATIDWYLQYLTMADSYKYGSTIVDNMDGWLVDLSGAVTLDREGAMTVLGITSNQFDDFATWWGANHNKAETDFKNWFNNEGNNRLDIWNMYDWTLDILNWSLLASKVGGSIVLTYDLVSWGMEALMARWLHEAFLPIEPYVEDMSMHASIGPTQTDLDLDTVVDYAVTAGLDSASNMMPYWGWEPMLGDYIASTPQHRYSEIDPYIGKTYLQTATGNVNFGYMVPYDYTPASWNLSAGETLRIDWPVGAQLFYDEIGTSTYVARSEPMFADSEPNDLASPNVHIDQTAGIVNFTGPLDVWDWSRNQTSNPDLSAEWTRVSLLPYGMPYVTFYPDAPPVASFVTDPVSSGNLTTVFSFDASASSDLEDNNSDLQYRWDWDGDGTWDSSWSYANATTHQFTVAGTYHVRLQVMDTYNLTAITSVTLIITDQSNTPPVASFVALPSMGDILTVFELNASGCSDLQDAATALEVRWDYNNDGLWDTGWSTQKVVTHQYFGAGTFTVKMEVRDTFGATNTTTLDIVVIQDVPEFPTILFPLVGVLALFVTTVAMRNRRRP